MAKKRTKVKAHLRTRAGKPTIVRAHERKVSPAKKLSGLTEQLARLLEDSGVSPDKAVIGAGGVLGAYDLKVVGDLDVWLTPSAYERLAAHPEAQHKVAKSGTPAIEFDTPAGEIEAFTGPWTVGDADFSGLKDTITKKGWSFWSPKKALRWKQAMNREKDQEDIKKLERFLGIEEGPHSTRFKSIPQAKDKIWDFAIQEHKAKRAGLHFDLRLGDQTGDAHSWAIRKLPAPGETSYAAQTFTHKADYMHFEGTLRGYGAGTVKLHTRSKAYVHSAGPSKVVFSVMRGRSTEDYALVRIKDKSWIIHNMSTPKDTIPRGKESYKEAEYGISLLDKYPDAIVAAKLDGAFTRILLRAGKRARAYSHRISKVGDTLEYTHKIPGMYDVRGGQGDTILRAEVVATDFFGKPLPPARTTALLNATVLNSREMQNTSGESLTTFLFDVEKLNGKDVSDLPVKERQALLRKFADKHPVFRLAPIAVTREEKKKLIKAIASKKHPLTSEGVILWEKKPIKAKVKKEHDVFIRQIHPGTGRLRDKAAGSFGYSWTARGPVVGNVGTGLTDTQRKDMWQNKEDYLGRVARVAALGKYRSGALEKPSFLGIHVEKSLK